MPIWGPTTRHVIIIIVEVEAYNVRERIKMLLLNNINVFHTELI